MPSGMKNQHRRLRNARRKRLRTRSAGPTAEFANALRNLPKAIAMQRNLVEVGSKLLASKEIKKARAFAPACLKLRWNIFMASQVAAPVRRRKLPIRVVNWDIPLVPSVTN